MFVKYSIFGVKLKVTKNNQKFKDKVQRNYIDPSYYVHDTLKLQNT